MTPPHLALVIEPDQASGDELVATLRAAGVDVERVASGDEAWHALAGRPPELLLVSLATGDLDRLHRRLRDEYMGRRPRIALLTPSNDVAARAGAYEVDCVLLRPVAPAILTALATGRCPVLPFDLGRSREMLKLSLLGGELQASLDAVAQRLVLVYGASNCTILAALAERQWVGSVGEAIPTSEWPALWLRVDQAVSAGAPLFGSVPVLGGPAQFEGRFAVAIDGPTGEPLGAIALTCDAPLLFGHEAQGALVDLAARLGVELSWRSVHDRLAAERDRLRETAVLDPMLGILGRGALEGALATELSRVAERGEPLTAAVIDVAGLRHINERHGHLVGDAVLRHVADATRREVRAQDVVGRWGDDEIAIVFAGTAIPAATAVVERIRRGLAADPLAGADGPITIEIAAGITDLRGPADEAALLPRAARTAAGARAKGGAIAIADPSSPAAGDTSPGVPLDRFDAGVTLGGMYQIVHEISRGAMGVVYRAEDLGLGRPVALKMLRPALVSDQELVRRFRAEAAVLARLDHENLVRVYSFVEDRDDVFFVMELVEGVSLDNVIIEANERGVHLPFDRVVAIVGQIASALDAMADASVMHRDVKPGNVVLDRTRDRAVLVDVGLARRRGEKSEPAGTPGFIAPESFRGDPEGAATDVYGLAATTYAMLTGHAPYGRADDYREILRRQLEERPPAPSSHRADLPITVDELLGRALAVDAADRPSTAGELAADLAGALLHVRAATRVDTVPVIDALAPGSRRTLTLDLEGVPPGGLEPGAMTRGVVFRAVGGVLGARPAATWLRAIERRLPALAAAVAPTTAALAWLPAERFDELLEAIAASGRNPSAFGRDLGARAAAESFRRLFPSSPESLAPATTLAALEPLWRRYQTWGALHALEIGDGQAQVVGTGTRGRAACAFVEGWLGQVLTMSGGRDASIVHAACVAQGDARCEFDARWA